MHMATAAWLVFTAVLSGTYSLEVPIDQVLSRASTGTGAAARFTTNGDVLVDGGKAVLRDLDIAEPLPCRTRNSEVPVSAADILIDAPGEPPVQGNAQDVVVQSNSDAPLCTTGDSSGRQKRNIYTLSGDWNTLNIPYTMTRSDFLNYELANIDAAFAEYEEYTCIKFIPRTNQPNKYIRIVREGGCWSYVGYTPSRDPQALSLVRGCAESKRTPIHELFHALGSWHQQSRPDRDTYIKINFANIQTNRESNFDLQTASNQLGTEYSYRSVMHYSRTAFSKNGFDTITTKDSSFQAVIGRHPTFSFEDLQVIHRYYKCDESGGCPTSNPCGEDQYRGTDCDCYCKNDHIDENVPAVLCSGSPCSTVNSDCSCTPAKCVLLENTVCNGQSGACECASGYALLGNDCILPGSIPCDKANENCLCSYKQPGSCTDVSNSFCDGQSNMCECNEGFQDNGNGACVALGGCTTIGVDCSCSTAPLGCSTIANSKCDQASQACICNEDYYPSDRQTCTRASSCTRPNANCKCSVQGLDACRRISSSICNSATDKCECLPFHRKRGRKCRANCSPVYISDGSSIAPFTLNTKRDQQFAAVVGDEPDEGSMFGLKANGMVLQASGMGNEDAIINVKRLSSQTSAMNLCISFNLKMTRAVFAIDYRTKGSRSWTTMDYEMPGIGGWGVPISEVFNVSNPKRTQFRFRATRHPDATNPSWEVSLDALIVRNCDCGAA